MSVNPLTRLRLFIANSYNMEDFRLLCTDLTILYDDLGGDDRISVKADRLLYLIGQQRRYEDLLLALRRTRSRAFEEGGFGELTPEALQDALPVYAGELAAELDRPPQKSDSKRTRAGGRYEVQEELGRGSFAVVYKALDTTLNRPVALKVMHPYWQEAPRFVARFRLEAQTAANLRHPNIVRVIDFGQGEDGRLFMAMEYLPGQTLHKFLEEKRTLELAQALPILRQVASALEYAHSQGIIHRDLKPSNIMLEETNSGLVAILTDFGLVKAMEGSVALTMHNAAFVGTVEYMAPEQADPNRQAEVGPATDRYALGVLAYSMLTGRVPFPGQSPATLYAHEHKQPPPPREIQPDLPETAEAALLKMLAKSPGERFASCIEFVTALAGPPPTGSDEQLAALYERLLKAAAEADWVDVLVLGGQISGMNPHYQDVPELIARAEEVLTRPGQRGVQETLAPSSDPQTVKDRNDLWLNPKTGKKMVRIPAGPFLFGEENEKRELPEFWIDKTPVTNAEYDRFLAEKGYEPPEHWQYNRVRDKKELPPELADHPVVNVSWEDANAYAEWAGGRLPSEEQWEKAARGPDGRQFPWGDEWQDGRCNTKEAGISQTTPVGQFSPAGDSAYGCVDMSGNVWEWLSIKEGALFILKGGSYHSRKNRARAAGRTKLDLDQGFVNRGFRVVVAAPSSNSDR